MELIPWQLCFIFSMCIYKSWYLNDILLVFCENVITVLSNHLPNNWFHFFWVWVHSGAIEGCLIGEEFLCFDFSLNFSLFYFYKTFNSSSENVVSTEENHVHEAFIIDIFRHHECSSIIPLHHEWYFFFVEWIFLVKYNVEWDSCWSIWMDITFALQEEWVVKVNSWNLIDKYFVSSDNILSWDQSPTLHFVIIVTNCLFIISKIEFIN